MQNFNDLYIMSDMDGTLISSSQVVSEENVRAINRFVENGGTFAVATGRPSHGVLNHLDGVNVNGYCIFSNGAVIYDRETEQIIESGVLDNEKLLPFIQKQIDLFPSVCVQLYTEKGLIVVTNCTAVDRDILRDNMEHMRCDMFDVADIEWNKMLFHSEIKSDLEEIEKNAIAEFGGIFELNFSSETYFEIIPMGYTKGDSLEKIRNMPKFAGKKFIAMGDHLNDVKMLQNADFSVCPTNAREGAKAVCNHLATVSCDQSLIAYVIEKLEKGEIKL